MEQVYLHWKKVIDQCWRLHELASWERVDHLVLGGEAMVDRQVLGRGTTFQCGLGSCVHYVHCAGAEMDGGDDPGAYRIEVDPCMDHPAIRIPQ